MVAKTLRHIKGLFRLERAHGDQARPQHIGSTTSTPEIRHCDAIKLTASTTYLTRLTDAERAPRIVAAPRIHGRHPVEGASTRVGASTYAHISWKPGPV